MLCRQLLALPVCSIFDQLVFDAQHSTAQVDLLKKNTYWCAVFAVILVWLTLFLSVRFFKCLVYQSCNPQSTACWPLGHQGRYIQDQNIFRLLNGYKIVSWKRSRVLTWYVPLNQAVCCTGISPVGTETLLLLVIIIFVHSTYDVPIMGCPQTAFLIWN
jgi:hypothetical protein